MVITSRGAKSGNLRKNPVMRVERDGKYVAIASLGGAPEEPHLVLQLRRPTRRSTSRTAPRSTPTSRASSRARSAPSGGTTPWRPGRRTASTRRRPTGRSRCSCSNAPEPAQARRVLRPPREIDIARPTRCPSRAISESRKSGPPRRPMTTISCLLSRAPQRTLFSSPDSSAEARSTWVHSQLGRRRPGGVHDAVGAVDPGAPVGAERHRQQVDRAGRAPARDRRSAPRRPRGRGRGCRRRRTCSPRPPGRRRALLQADTIESGIVRGAISRSTSSTAVPLACRFSTISIASMSPPASPMAAASRPRDPGTSGSSTRSR